MSLSKQNKSIDKILDLLKISKAAPQQFPAGAGKNGLGPP